MAAGRDEPDARVYEDTSAVALGTQALDDPGRKARPPEEADRLAAEEVRAVRRARRQHT